MFMNVASRKSFVYIFPGTLFRAYISHFMHKNLHSLDLSITGAFGLSLVVLFGFLFLTYVNNLTKVYPGVVHVHIMCYIRTV